MQELTAQALSWQLVINYLAMMFIQFVKTNKAPFLSWINTSRPNLTRFVAALISSVTAAGIHFRFSPDAAMSGTYVFTVSGLTAIALAHFLKDVLQNYLGIKMFYKVLRPDENWGSGAGPVAGTTYVPPPVIGSQTVTLPPKTP